MISLNPAHHNLNKQNYNCSKNDYSALPQEETQEYEIYFFSQADVQQHSSILDRFPTERQKIVQALKANKPYVLKITVIKRI
jgi:hypothetical protein